MKINLPNKIKIWIQFQSLPIWVEVIEQNEKGFPIKVKTNEGKILSRSRVNWALMIFEDMVI